MKLTKNKVSAIKFLREEGGFKTSFIAEAVDLSSSTVKRLIQADFNHDIYTSIRRPKKNDII